MKGFEQTITILTSLINYFEELQEFLQRGQKDPEIFLTESFLQYDADRNYLWTNILACCGDDGLNQFLLEYYDCVIKALKCKIPISDVHLQYSILNGDCVLLGIIQEQPVMAINTFSKTVYFLPDEHRIQLEQAIENSENFIEQLMNQFEELNTQKGGLLKAINKKAYEQKLQMEKNTLIGQIYAEQETLRTLQENLENYDDQMAEILQIRDRYYSRLKSYYDFKLT